MMKIVIAIDKFKGSATSAQLAHAIEHTIIKEVPNCDVVKVPIADGGDGTVNAIKEILGDIVTFHNVEVHRPIINRKPVKAHFLLDSENHTAYMDLATASGLALVPQGERDIMSASTYGTGEMIAHAINSGANHIVLGLGGSATCDGGIGILAALGCKFQDASDDMLPPCAASLEEIKIVDTRAMDEFTQGVRFTLLTDVDNPLLGDNGAAAIFAPQKGATPQQVEILENGLANLTRFMPADVPCVSGAGAAGGVAAGMMAFLDAKIEPGIDKILSMAHFDEVIHDAHLIITGEGRIDTQTAMGKAPAGVLRMAQQHNIPVIALCGSVDPKLGGDTLGFSSIIPVTPIGMPLEEAMRTATTISCIEKAVHNIISTWNLKKRE